MEQKFNIQSFAKANGNGSAIVTSEKREGPSLLYIGEKIRYSLEHLHRAFNDLKPQVPDIINEENDKNVRLLYELKAAFRLQFIAFSSLHNIASLGHEEENINALLDASYSDFEECLAKIENFGSVNTDIYKV